MNIRENARCSHVPEENSKNYISPFGLNVAEDMHALIRRRGLRGMFLSFVFLFGSGP